MQQASGRHWGDHDVAHEGRQEGLGLLGSAIQAPAAGGCWHRFFSHRQIGVTAGFTGSNYLLEQGPLEVWWLSIL